VDTSNLTVEISYEKESSDAPFIAYSPELDVASCGPTEKKARENLKEAIEIILESTEKGEERPVLVPRYETIPIKVLETILRAAKISPERFLELLDEV
jgi:predicted RNase H-like HicB family nuclease